jgi:hypothetical protein
VMDAVSILHVCLGPPCFDHPVSCVPRTRAVTADPSSRTHMPSQPVSHSNSSSPAISAPMPHRREIRGQKSGESSHICRDLSLPVPSYLQEGMMPIRRRWDLRPPDRSHKGPGCRSRRCEGYRADRHIRRSCKGTAMYPFISALHSPYGLIWLSFAHLWTPSGNVMASSSKCCWQRLTSSDVHGTDTGQ